MFPIPLTKVREAELKKRPAPVRVRLLDERASITHEFAFGGYEGKITVGFYEDGSVGEVFIEISKEGSTVSGLVDGIATLLSTSLQYGVPLKPLVKKFANVRYEPNGRTKNPCIPETTSIIDYLFRWLALVLLTNEEMAEIGIVTKCASCENTGECKVKKLRPVVITPITTTK